MQRQSCHPRPHWREKVESLGLTYHSHATGPYWEESACYRLSAQEVLCLESAANTLHQLCLEAAGVVIEKNWWHRLRIPPAAIPAILRSWERDDFSLYGRFDLAFDGTLPKLLEYNADTPTSLLEASVVQWFWLEEQFPGCDQFNSIHERLILAWQRWAGKTIHFSGVKDHEEDEQTLLYLRDTCEQAGACTRPVSIEDMGWHPGEGCFVDLEGVRIDYNFKLYPWEWLWHEDFGLHLNSDCVHWIEPCWKMLLSNKGLLPILWELFPDHPNLLPAFESPDRLGNSYIRKPRLSREGGNITLVQDGVILEQTGGDYGEEGFIYQALAPETVLAGHRPVCGLWMIDHTAAGLGIREDTHRITGNLSRFVPHYFPDTGALP